MDAISTELISDRVDRHLALWVANGPIVTRSLPSGPTYTIKVDLLTITWTDGKRTMVTCSGWPYTKAGVPNKRDTRRHNVYYQFREPRMHEDTPEWVRLLVKEYDRD